MEIYCFLRYHKNMLKDKVRLDLKEAFKAKDQTKLSVLKMVQSEIGNAEINKRAKLIKDGKTENLEVASALNDGSFASRWKRG